MGCRFPFQTDTARGVTLVEMALVLALIGLLAAFFLPMGTKMREAKQIEQTRAKLQAIEAALTRYVMLNNRLPCPANGTLDESAANAGQEQATSSGNCTAANSGVVPWRALGLTANDAVDAWNTRVTYRVYDNSLASLTLHTGSDCGGSTYPLLNAKNADQWGNFLKSCPTTLPKIGFSIDGDVSTGTCTSLIAQPSDGSVPRTGVAYVLISHGTNKCGGYTRSGIYVSACSGSAGMSAAEQNNRNNNAPLHTSGCYKDGNVQDNGFDDIVLWRTIMQVAADAKKVN